MTVLFDTSFLVALWSERDKYHKRAMTAMQNVRSGRVIGAPMLTELFYMLTDRVDYQIAVQGFMRLQTVAFQIEPLTTADMLRMSEIMMQYATSQFDYVDVALMALSERLNIFDVFTFDRRDFSIFRPAHTSALTLLP